MREFLLTSALILATVSVFAAKPFKVTKGSLDVFKQDVTATWVIDLSEAQFVNNGIFAKENKGDFKTWCEDDYDERVRLMNDAFFDAFNVYSTGMELVKEGDGFEDDRDAYTMDNIFFVPEEARWSTISTAAHTPEIGKVIDNAMRLDQRLRNLQRR